jgi:membrane protease YdiL (CAAX protease family)
MTPALPAPPGFWKTVGLLLAAARRRSRGRQRRQQEILNQRNASDWGGLAELAVFAFLLIMSGLAALIFWFAISIGQRFDLDRQGKSIVSREFYEWAECTKSQDEVGCGRWTGAQLETSYKPEAEKIAKHLGGSAAEIEARLRASVAAHGAKDLVVFDGPNFGYGALPQSGPITRLLGSMVLLAWWLMLALQGEGMEMDTQRRRHPMWEWLFSHPASPAAIFLAEILSPLAANAIYWCAPLTVGIIYGMTHGLLTGLLASLVAGVPLSIAAACTSKALEIGVTLRFPPRSRGAILGLMSWLGYALFIFFFLGAMLIEQFGTVIARACAALTVLPWPVMDWALGFHGGELTPVRGIAACALSSMVAVVLSVRFCVWGAERGLVADAAQLRDKVTRSPRGASFGRDPLYRKELLWFRRDRSAIVQAILVPATVAISQVFNFRIFLRQAQNEWNYLCGAAIFFGTYFLWVLGPKSLNSEGSALWIAMTWPRGMESLLKAKAKLWAWISTGLIVPILLFATLRFPRQLPAIVLVGVAWLVFARSMADKCVTLVTITRESGETERPPKGRYWAAQLGMLTFAIGVITRQWHIAINGIVYSYLTAAAMWQNFRARLPYLFDPWSEETPQPPTLLHAMVSVAILIDLTAILAALVSGLGGREYLAVSLAVGYILGAVIVWIGVQIFLSERNVLPRDIWLWPAPAGEEQRPFVIRIREAFPSVAFGAVAGAALALLVGGYLIVLRHIPLTAELMRQGAEEMHKAPEMAQAYAFVAIFAAPFAEEFLFRGLLYRALDREWGGWAAVLGSAAFFAIYHPVLSWLPVATLGVCNALLFKKCGRLAPAVALHMAYNALIVLWQ